MPNILQSSVLLTVIGMLVGCSYTPQELVAKIDSEDAYKSKAKSEVCSYTLQWLPKEYLAVTELNNVKDASSALLDSKIRTYSQSYYFKLSLELNSGENAMLNDVRNTNEYSQKWNYLTYGMGKKLYFLTATYDTIYPSFYTFQNPYIYNNKLNFLYVFSKKNMDGALSENITLKFKDEVFSQQNMSFYFKDFKGMAQKEYTLKLKK